jgi:DegV family protein with EDD domain
MLLAVDGAVDLPVPMAASARVRVVSGAVWLGGQHFVGDRSEFWSQLRSGADFSTTPPSVSALTEAYRTADPVCALHVSAALSATVAHAREAASLASTQVAVIDTRSLSVGSGLVAAILHDSLVSGQATAAGSVADEARFLCDRLHTFALIQDVTTLRRSGRAGLLPGREGSRRRPLILGLRGRAIALDEPKDRAAAIRQLAARAQDASRPAITAWALGHGDAFDLGKVQQQLTVTLGTPPRFVTPIDPTVGAHVGPDAIVVGALS